ncbi:hypothetical protein M4951_06555 [Blastopirellula sp. J2-11]|uniref:hypothetical protein n=1 Tax=Blastopirellula sp. J2-11 TaxID=2943192 RepID=UPI0021C964B7|nr:hypothetical protein [Blastopirellula sp. J2-11]UUO07971.1 hypothetical protein M4951_06555 [Blastopirellula sp. J2-11]
MTLLKRIWNDEAGFIVSTELILIATILVIGLVVGLTSIRDAVVTELADVSGAISDLDQSYVFGGVAGHAAATAGSDYTDNLDFCDVDGQGGLIASCITIGVGTNDHDEAGGPLTTN